MCRLLHLTPSPSSTLSIVVGVRNVQSGRFSEINMLENEIGFTANTFHF